MTVFGTGYLGATHASCMAELGYEVLGVDIDQSKIDGLAAGKLPFYEPGLDEVLQRNLANGRLRFTTSVEEAAEFGDIHFIGVGTPQKKGEFGADTSALDSVIDALAPLLTRACVIAGKSTVPVGTAARLAAKARELAPAGDDVELVWNPEFLREGFAVEDTLRPDRLVLGLDPARPGKAEDVMREAYRPMLESNIPMITTDYATAELVKVSANAFLATKISFINAVSEVCDVVGADVVTLADAIGHDARIGRRFLNAGMGFGGGCLPKDIRAFMARAGELGADEALVFLREVDTINMRRRERVVELAKEMLGGQLLGKRIAVLGAAFKPDSDDVRDSPALSVAGQMHLAGAQVSVYDPQGMNNARKVFPTLNYSESAIDACKNANLVLHATEWPEFRQLDPTTVGNVVTDKKIIDGRNALDVDRWRGAGWTFKGLGRP
jgi:UDPglucose 6-dehydrogenase